MKNRLEVLFFSVIVIVLFMVQIPVHIEFLHKELDKAGWGKPFCVWCKEVILINPRYPFKNDTIAVFHSDCYWKLAKNLADEQIDKLVDKMERRNHGE